MARELQLFFKELNDHKIIHPQELLELFKKYAPHALTQKEAKLIFEELGTYLTEEEAHRLIAAAKTAISILLILFPWRGRVNIIRGG